MKKQLFMLLALFVISVSQANTDKYRLILMDDPATTITIAWNQISGSDGIVKYGTQDFGQNAGSYPLQKTVDRSVNYRGMNNKFVRLSGLLPNTAYYFVIEDNEGVSQRFWFKTSPDDQSKMSFIAGGDSRNNLIPRQNANLMVSKLKPNAVLFGGDMINIDNDSEWQQWFDDWQLTTASDGRMFPIVPTRGNHEQASSIYNLFDTPTPDSYYALTFGADFFRVIVLNSEISVFGNQLTWLENELTANDNHLWKYAQYHRPIRPHNAAKAEGVDRYNAWAELFYLHAVRLVLESDSHVVKTTYPVKPSNSSNNDEGFEIDMDRGTVYTGEGCWGAPLRPNDDDKSWTRGSASFNQFKWIFVDDQKIEMRTIKVDNASSVSELSNNDPFAMPNNLDVWTMPDGEQVVTIFPSQSFQQAEAAFSSTMEDEFEDCTDITVELDILSPGAGIDYVTFSATKNETGAPEIILEVLNQDPFIFTTALPEDGQYQLKATVTTIENLSVDVYKNINVGTFTMDTFVGISSGNNDIEESEVAGNMYFNSSDLELGFDSHAGQNYQKLGLRFENVTIPKGAQIIDAYIQFSPKDTHNTPAQSTLFIEDTDHALEFSNQNFDLTDRVKITDSVVWDIDPWVSNVADHTAKTPPVTELLQAVINREDWEANNAISFMLAPSGPSLASTSNKRNAISYDGNANAAPKLYFTYYYSVNQYENIAPQAEFAEEMATDFEDRTTVEIMLDILDEGAGIDEVQFFAKKNGETIPEINLGSLFSPPYTFTTSLPEDGQYIIKAVVNSVNNTHIEVYTPINVGTFNITSYIAITDGSNDVEEAELSGFMLFHSNDLQLGYDDSFADQLYQHIGLRFENLPIPKGAQLESAYIQFTPKDSHYTSAESTIYVEDNLNAMEFSNTAFDLSDRAKLTDSIVWQMAPWDAGVVNGNTQTPELKDVLQSMIDHEDWGSNNAVSFMFAPSGPSLGFPSNKRNAYAYEGNPEAAPRLYFTFSYSTTTLSTNHEEIPFPITVHPNPVKDFVNIGIANHNNQEITVVITDVHGRRVEQLNRSMIHGKASVNLSNLNSGLYFMTLYSDDNILLDTKKIIKK